MARLVGSWPRAVRDCFVATAAPLAVAGAAELWPGIPAVWRWVALLAAVLLASWRRGLRAAVVSLGVASLLATFLWLPPRYSLEIEAPEQRLALAIFIGLAASLLVLEACLPDGPINEAAGRRAATSAFAGPPSSANAAARGRPRRDWPAQIVRLAARAFIALSFGWLAFHMAIQEEVGTPVAVVLAVIAGAFGLLTEAVLRDSGS